MKFSHTFIVDPYDIDEQGHVNNVAYVRWIQDVAAAHWLAAVDAGTRSGLAWILTRHEIDYLREAFEGDAVTATTWVGNATRVTCERFTEVARDGGAIIKARSVWCLVDRKSKRPIRISDELRTIFGMTSQERPGR